MLENKCSDDPKGSSPKPVPSLSAFILRHNLRNLLVGTCRGQKMRGRKTGAVTITRGRGRHPNRTRVLEAVYGGIGRETGDGQPSRPERAASL